MHTTPQLEILADDVKCKHGSTTGQLDPAALFYLRSRGIGEAAARAPADLRVRERACCDTVPEPRARGGSSGTCRRACPARRARGGGVVSAPQRRPSDRAARRRARSARDFPILRADRARQAARLPRQRGQRAEAARGDRRRARGTTSATTRTSTAACTSSRAVATDAYEAAREQGRSASSARASTREIDLHCAAPPRRINLVAQSYGRATSAPATRC